MNTITDEIESKKNESPERIALQNEAQALAELIVSLPDIPEMLRAQIDLTDDTIIEKYLGDIHLKVQDLIERTFNVNNYNGTLSKDRALTNFTRICDLKEIRFFNPFNLFILRTKNYNSLLRNRF